TLIRIRPMSPPRDDFADGAGIVGGKEQPAIGNGDNGARAATADGDDIFADHLPSGAMRPILLEKFSVNQRSPSGATVTPRKEAFGVFTGHSVTHPSASMRPSALALVSTNQMLPSGCTVMARGSLFGVGILYSVT